MKDYGRIKDGSLKALGMLTVMTALQGGSGLPLFNSATVDFLLYGHPLPHSVGCLPSIVKDGIEKVGSFQIIV